MTKFDLLAKIGYFGKGEVSMEDMVESVDRYTEVLIAAKPNVVRCKELLQLKLKEEIEFDTKAARSYDDIKAHWYRQGALKSVLQIIEVDPAL